MAAAASARLLGAAVTIVGDVNPLRLAHAKSVGFETVDLSQDAPLGEQIAAILGTLGALAGLLSFTTFPGLAVVIASLASLGLLVVNILWLVNAFSGEEAAYTRQGRPAGA